MQEKFLNSLDKEQLIHLLTESNNELKMLSGVYEKVNDIHAIQFNKYQVSPSKPSKKTFAMDCEEIRQRAHDKVWYGGGKS